VNRGRVLPEESASLLGLAKKWIPRFARNDKRKKARLARVALASAWALALLFLIALPAHATTYYVAAAGSDSNNGTSTGTPWQTIAKVNGSMFSPGDSILFNRGDAWYGTALTVPSSGSSGLPITFGAYGTGANPIVKGSVQINTSGYVLAPNTTTTIFARNDTGTNSNDSATRNWREQIGHQDITNPAVKITVSLTAAPSAALNITGAGIGPAATAPNTSAITRITWDGGNNGTTIAAGTTKTSDQINYSLDNTIDQMATVFTTARNVEYYGNNFETLWSNFSGPDQSQSATVSGYSTGGNCVIASIVAINITAFTYDAPAAFTPVALWENDNLLKLTNNPLGVDQTAGSWYYDGTNLYIHASDGSNVATNGKTYSYVTASSPGHTAWDNGQSYLIFDSIDEAETYNTDSTAQTNLGGLILTGANNIVRNLSIHDNFRHDFSVYTGATGNVLTNVTGYNSYGTSPVTIYGPGTTGNTVQKSTFYNDTYLREANVFTGAVWTVIVAHGGSTGNVVDSCVIYSTAGPFSLNTNIAHGYGVLVGDSGTSLTVSHSILYGNFEWGVYVGQNGDVGEGPAGQVTMWDNLIDASQSYLSSSGGNAAYFYGATGNILYDNTIYAPLMTNPAISALSTSTGTLAKNNIVYAGGYVTVDSTSESGAAIDYNDYFPASGTPFSWGGTAYTFANWQTNSLQDAHSFSADPKLVNASSLSSTGNYSLLAVSPAIDAGTNLGSTYQNALSPASSWPSGVSLLNQNLAGSGWEIGGYVFPASAPRTLLLRGCCD
jgi:hypothetical protein